MKIAVHGKSFSPDFDDAIKQILKRIQTLDVAPLIEFHFKRFLDERMSLTRDWHSFDEPHQVQEVDLLIAIGGDGTVLEAATFVRDTEIPVLGVNTGRLGFLSNVRIDEIDLAMDAVAAGKVWYEKRLLLKVEVDGMEFGEFPYALNEVAIMKRDTSSMVAVEVERDDTFVNNYWADGLIVATPTGSTAYSLSAGGPIVMPGSEVLCINPVAPHNLNNRPLVIPAQGELQMTADGRENQFLLSLDSRMFILDGGRKVRVTPASFRFVLMNLEHQEFFSTIRAKMHWGKDPRDR
ncbi:MAG: NAD kinase [Crocinitomicaceae bacterium]|jgi:NAD+ kinase|nr:NAD kinase [Crocinitomicaceae bacterium]